MGCEGYPRGGGDRRDNTLQVVEFGVLHETDYCSGYGKLMCTLGNYTARLAIGKKLIGWMTAAGDLDGTKGGCGG